MAPRRGTSGDAVRLPFDHDAVPAAVAAAEIAAALTAIRPRILLFLRNIERLRPAAPGCTGSVIERSDRAAGQGPRREVTL